MLNIEIPLSLVAENKVRLFKASVYCPEKPGTYAISFTCCIREFESDLLCDKHAVFEDYSSHIRHVVARRSPKQEAVAEQILRDNLQEKLRDACKQYGLHSIPSVGAAVTKFGMEAFELYKGLALNLDVEAAEILGGIQECMEFCRDYAPEEEDELPDPLVYSLDARLKLVYLTRDLCNQLQSNGVLEKLIDAGLSLNQIGNDLYYGIVGHGVGFRDRLEADVLAEVLEPLEKTMDRYYLHPFIQDGEIGLDLSIDKKGVKL